MSLKKFVPLILVASAALLVAAPARAAVVFEFESAAIDAFRNWTPPGQQSHDDQGNQGNNGHHQNEGNQGNQGPIDPPPPDTSLLDVSTAGDVPPPATEQLTAAVPEPGTWALLALGLAGIAATRRRTPKR